MMNHTTVHRLLPLALCVACSLAVASCVKVTDVSENDYEGFVPDKDNPIAFATHLRKTTKGDGNLDLTSIRTKGFGVTAYWRGAGYIFDGADDAHNYLRNARPVYQGIVGGKETWTFSPTVWWPVKGGLSFFAYAPYIADGSPYHEIQPTLGGEYPGGRFTQAAEPGSMIDFCLADPKFDLTGAAGTVNFVFEHALTNILFYLNIKGAVYPGEDYSYRIKSITVSGVAGENTYVYGGSVSGSFHWTDLPRQDLSARTASYTLSRSSGHLVSTFLPHEKDLGGVTGLDRYVHVNSPESGVLYMLPQPMASSAKVSFILTACTVSGSTVTEVRDLDPIDVWLPETTVWEPGTIVAYLISLDTTTWVETLFRTSVSPWTETSGVAPLFVNAVKVRNDAGTCTIAEVGNAFTAGDLKVNPPLLYVNDVLVTVNSWSHVGTTLTAYITGGNYSFTLSDGQPVSVSFTAGS